MSAGTTNELHPSGFAIAATENRIWLIGGRKDTTSCNENKFHVIILSNLCVVSAHLTDAVEYFDGWCWSYGPEYPFPVHGHSAVGLPAGNILSCGGSDDEDGMVFSRRFI